MKNYMFTYNYNFNFFLDNGRNNLHVYIFNWSENLDSGAFWYAEQVYLGTIHMLRLKYYMFKYNFKICIKNKINCDKILHRNFVTDHIYMKISE